MFEKIIYRTILSHNGYINKRDEIRIELVARQGKQRVFFDTGVRLKKEHFQNGLVVNHPNSNELNMFLFEKRYEIERVELEYIINNKASPTLFALKEAYKAKSIPSALLVDFGREVIENSDRKQSTKNGYEVFFNNFNLFRESIRLCDVNYDFLVKYANWQKSNGISENTAIGRMQQLKTIISEAYKRNIIKENPFNRYKIPSMKNKQGFLTEEQLNKIEKLPLNGKEKIAKDAFLFSCYTGLRYSDLASLTNNDIKDGWIKKVMKKTGKEVEVPLSGLFDDKPLKIIEEYGGDVARLSKRMGQCGTLNKILKNVFLKIGLADTKFTFHTSRHTCASLLLLKGFPMTTVQKILGHTKINTTAIYAEVTKDVIESDIKKLQKKKR